MFGKIEGLSPKFLYTAAQTTSSSGNIPYRYIVFPRAHYIKLLVFSIHSWGDIFLLSHLQIWEGRRPPSLQPSSPWESNSQRMAQEAPPENVSCDCNVHVHVHAVVLANILKAMQTFMLTKNTIHTHTHTINWRMRLQCACTSWYRWCLIPHLHSEWMPEWHEREWSRHHSWR